MKNFFYFIIATLFFSMPASAAYNGKESTSISIEYGQSATVTIMKDLIGKFDSVKVKKFGEESWSEYTVWSNKFTITGAGMYDVKFTKSVEGFIYDSVNVVWKQSVYVPFSQPENAEDLAKQYLPVVIFNNDESYFPQSLETILSFNKEGEENSIEIAGLHNDASHFMGEDIKKYMEYNGHSDSYFNFGKNETTCATSDGDCTFYTPLFLRESIGDVKKPTIYWDASIEDNALYLTYYFFYAFDPKTGSYESPATAAHGFDREAFTIEFELTEDVYTPVNVTYAGHLDTQTMEFNGCKELENCIKQDETFTGNNEVYRTWTGGKTTISWDNALKVGKHPIIYNAKGAHAIYPTYGFYSVLNYGSELISLIEPAGSVNSSKILLPSNLNSQDNTSISLQKLDYSVLKYLSFSGYWVDVLASKGAKFPPFMRTPYANWLSDTNTVFDDCLNADVNNINEDCTTVNTFFDSIRGIGDYHAVTVKVVDDESSSIIPDAQVRLSSSNGTLNLLERTLSDGMYSFFFIPENNLTYQLYAYTPDYGEIECGASFTVSVDQLILNNEAVITCSMSVPEVTGNIEGKVIDAVLNSPLNNVLVSIFQNGAEIETVHTGGEGIYDITLPVGEYNLNISAENYIPAQINITVVEGETTTVTELQQVSNDYIGIGVVKGVLSNAFNGSLVSSVLLEVRSGVNSYSGTVINSVVTNTSGEYELSLQAGNYTIQASKDGYTNTYFNIVSIGTLTRDNQNASISPILNDEEIRIILSWGGAPNDLDSHLLTPEIDGNSYHIYYSNKGSSLSLPFSNLDTDETSGYGPETITLYSRFAGIYTFYVYNYSGSPDIKSSQAKVEVYTSSGLEKTYNVPLSGDGKYWNVLTIDGLTGTIVPINTITTSAP